jgi:hypothetical protein
MPTLADELGAIFVQFVQFAKCLWLPTYICDLYVGHVCSQQIYFPASSIAIVYIMNELHEHMPNDRD